MRLRLERVGRRFGTGPGAVDAVRDVTLEVEDGEYFVLLGPSGCGKSTLLELCAGLQTPTAGTIRFDERVVADAGRGISTTPRERDVAMVFQSYALYPHMSVFDNVAFPLRIARLDTRRIERAVHETAEMLGIAGLLERRPRELSGGQRQRVAIARALVRRPAVFLLDEPLSNLDAQLRASTRAELKRLQRRLGVTTLHVTHDQLEALTLGDRIALVRSGELVQVGSPMELYEEPATAFVATFLGAPPMNLVRAGISRSGEELRVAIGPEEIALPRSRRVHVTDGYRALLGIRSERLRLELAGAGRTPGPVLAGRVTAVEPIGREFLCHVTLEGTGGQTLVASTLERGVRPGSDVRLRFDPADAHLFPPE